MLATESEKIYRYSSKSIFYVYNIFTDKLHKISEDKIMHATFSPNGEKIAYVKNNNLFIYDIKNNSITTGDYTAPTNPSTNYQKVFEKSGF